MSKPSFLEVLKAVNRVCLGLSVGAAVGAPTGAAVFVWQLILQEIGYGGWMEFEPWVDVDAVAFAGAANGLFAGGFIGLVIGLWKVVRGSKLKLR